MILNLVLPFLDRLERTLKASMQWQRSKVCWHLVPSVVSTSVDMCHKCHMCCPLSASLISWPTNTLTTDQSPAITWQITISGTLGAWQILFQQIDTSFVRVKMFICDGCNWSVRTEHGTGQLTSQTMSF